jgi:hypothetical protein
VVEAKISAGAYMLQDKLYLIKVDSINKDVVLDKNSNIQVGAAAAFGKENDTTITKIN